MNIIIYMCAIYGIESAVHTRAPSREKVYVVSVVLLIISPCARALVSVCLRLS